MARVVPRVEPGLAVGGGALVLHRLPVQQHARRPGAPGRPSLISRRGGMRRVRGPTPRPFRVDGPRSPASWDSSVDFPEPLRPITATTSPADDVEVDAAERHHVAEHHREPPGRGHRRAGRLRAPVRRAPARGGGASRRRRGPAIRRASRTVSGTGDQPASRASSTMGGATGDVAMMSAVPPPPAARPARAPGPPGRRRG